LVRLRILRNIQGTFPILPPYHFIPGAANQNGFGPSDGTYGGNMSEFFDARFNKVLDSSALRISLMLAGFGAWLAIGVGVLKLGM